MDEIKRRRCAYVSARQKKKLIELMTQHPELIACKVTQDFNYKDSQRLWQNIANECNSMPGAKKTWRQWRKTWHDLRSKTKKKQVETNGEVPTSAVMLTAAEQEALGIKHVSLTDNYQNSQDITEFIHFSEPISAHESNYNETESVGSLSEPDSPIETKVFSGAPGKKMTKLKNHAKLEGDSKHLNKCNFNCDTLAAQEERKIQIKEEYLNFKKDYLKQKLKLLKEQTEALKSIAKELCK